MKFKFLQNKIDFDSNLFEVLFTLLCVFISTILGILNFPQNVPINMFNYLTIVALLGFVTGFLVSSGFVEFYRNFSAKLNQVADIPAEHISGEKQKS